MLTYIPTGFRKFIFTSSRDERAVRQVAFLPRVLEIEKVKVLFPVDPQSNGTWIATSSKGRTANILNGAINKNQSGDNYRMSRGLVMLDLFRYENIDDFTSKYNLENIAPFTMIIIENSWQLEIKEFKWDGENRNLTAVDPSKPHLWLSSNLYSEQNLQLAGEAFKDWLSIHESDADPKKIMDFHYSGAFKKIGKPLKKATEMPTVSMTCIQSDGFRNMMHYRDLINDQFILNEIKTQIGLSTTR